jgi:hypothetical protein
LYPPGPPGPGMLIGMATGPRPGMKVDAPVVKELVD